MTTAALRFYDLVVFIHIAAVVTAFGVTFVYPLIIPLTTRTQPDKLPWLHRVQDEIGKKVIAPSAGVVLLAGLYLALSGDGGYDFGNWWVGFGLIVVLVILGLGGAFFGPNDRRLAELAERDLGAGGLGGEYRALQRRVLSVNLAADLLIVLTILFMVLGARGVFS